MCDDALAFTLPPHDMNSHFATISHVTFDWRPILLILTRGVMPTWSMIESDIFGRSQQGGAMLDGFGLIADCSEVADVVDRVVIECPLFDEGRCIGDEICRAVW